MDRSEFLLKLTQDADFKDKFMKDPAGVAQQAGLSLDEAARILGVHAAGFGISPTLTTTICHTHCTLTCSGGAGVKSGQTVGTILP